MKVQISAIASRANIKTYWQAPRTACSRAALSTMTAGVNFGYSCKGRAGLPVARSWVGKPPKTVGEHHPKQLYTRTAHTQNETTRIHNTHTHTTHALSRGTTSLTPHTNTHTRTKLTHTHTNNNAHAHTQPRTQAQSTHSHNTQ